MADKTYTVIDNIPCGIWGCEFLASVRTHNPFAEMPMDQKEIDLCLEHGRDFWPERGETVAQCKGCELPTRRADRVCIVCFNLAPQELD